MKRKTTIVAIITALAVLMLASTASAVTIKGKVVHKNRSAHSYTVAKHSGQLVTIHAKKSPALGRKVVVRAHLLANGTYGQRGIQIGRLTHRATIHGVVTYVNARGTKAVVSGKGVSLVAHKAATARAAAKLCAGDVVTITGSFDDDGDIDCEDVDVDGVDDGYIELEGHLLAVDLGARTLTLSADDEEELPGTVTVIIPADWDMSGYVVGDEIEVTATLNADGTFTAVGTSHDCDEEEADDEDCAEGDDCDEVEGIIKEIDIAGRTLTLTGDDDDLMVGATIVVRIPDGWDMAEFEVGDEIEVIAVQNDDGTFTAVSAELDDVDEEGEIID